MSNHVLWNAQTKAIINIFRTQFFLFSFISELIADCVVLREVADREVADREVADREVVDREVEE